MLSLFLWTTLLLGGFRLPAQTITQWNFNSSPPDASASTGTTAPSTGSGTASLIGGTTATFASGDANGGSTDPTTGSPTDDSGWNISGFAAQGTNNETSGVQFLVSTVGKQNIVVKWDQRHSNTSSRYVRFQYTTNGTTWINYDPLFEGTAGDTWFNSRTVDLSAISAVNNNANFGFRIVAAFAPTTSAYSAANASSSYGTTSTWRFDMVTVSGSTVASTPTVNLSVNPGTGSEAAQTVVTVTATASGPVSGDQTVSLSVNGTGITTSDYSLSNPVITIPGGSSSGSVTFTVANDTEAEGTEIATLTIGSPSSGLTLGSTVSQNVTILDDDVVANTAPTILADNETIIDPEKVTPFLSVPDASPVGSPTAFVSGVISDPTDPARTVGIEFNLADAETPSGLTVTATSSNAAVVPDANLSLTGTGLNRNLKITPTGVGYATLTVTVNDGSLSNSYVISYAASAPSVNTTTTRFHTGTSDASTAQAVDASYVLVGDDENQRLRLYDRANSGLPLASFDYTTSLGLTDLSGGVPREVDIEASAQVGNRIYWLGSQSNSSGGNARPNRQRLFATDVSGTGAGTTLAYVGRYDGLKTDLLAWDASNGHGLGANYLGLTASAATGKQPEDPNLDGFNIEGLTVAPDGTTGYLGFRAPQQPTAARTKALIVPWTNMTALVSGNPTTGPAQFGAPILLDLGGRGIREMKRSSGGQYLIAAGPADGATGTAPKDFRLYTWTGNATDAPVLRAANLTALNANGSFESIVDLPATLTSTSQIQLLVDNGDAVFYNDGTIAKDLSQNNFKKFRSELVALGNPALVKIHDIQGVSSTFDPAFGGVQTIEGIVTRTFTGSTKLNGFYVQEEDADADADAATSEGIFVFDPSGLFSGNAGDKVRVTGTVAEFTSSSGGVTSSLTQLSSLTGVVNLGAGTLPSVTNVTLPVANVSDLERYEGMLVNVSATSGNLTVTEYFQLGRFGQVVLSATGASNQPGTDARLDQYTQFNAPSTSGYAAYLAELAKRRIILDDGSSVQNPDPILFGRGGNPLSASNTLRGGDEVASLTGILDQRFEGYRVQTTTGVNFTAANPRPAAPPAVGGTLRVASANVLNFFNGDGAGGGFPTSRGADNLNEFNRQRAKIVQALTGSGADVIGLMEVENDGYGPTSAIQDLVNGLNAAAGAGTYAFVTPGTSLSTDEITVGIIYKPAKVTPVGAAATMPAGYGSGAFDLVGRKPLAQTFQETSTGGAFTLVVNHFKSKGSSAGGVGDADAGDGQGASNGTRTRQAQDLATWLATKPTGTADPDYLVVGDLNAYAKEDPLTTLATAGYGNLLPTTSYSYVFDAQVGSLDHALATSGLAAQVNGAEKWHINADEPSVLDYNTEFKSAGQITSLYNADQFRASDHDPVLVGLNLTVPFAITASPIMLTQGQTTQGATIGTVSNAASLPNGATVTASPGNNGVSLANISLNTTTGAVTADVTATCPATNASFTLTLNGSGAATAPTATLGVTVNALPLTASVGGGGSACAGSSVAVNFTGTPNATVTYTVNGGSNQTIQLDGNGSANVSATASGTYTLVSVSNGNCPRDASGSATVTITPLPTASLGGGGSACAGSSVAVNFNGTPNATVTYTVNGGSNQTIQLDGSGSASVAATASGTYALISVSLSSCSQNLSGSAIVTITPNPTVTASASPNPVCENATLTLSAQASGGTGTLSYAWSGPNGFSASTNPATRTVTLADGGVYSVTVTDEKQCKTTVQTAVVTVSERVRLQSITPSQSVCPNADVTLTVQATGSNLTYQWYRVLGNQAQPVAGGNSASLTVNLQAPTSYYVVVTGPCNQVTSSTVALSFKPPTTLRITSINNQVCEGSNLTLSVAGNGPGSLQYSWRKDAPTGPVIATGSSFTLTNAQVADAGTYYATVAGDCPGPTVSIPVTVRYVRITTQPQSQQLCTGVATLSVAVQTVGVTATYQWKRNGQAISGATGASYPVTRTGNYTVEVKTSCVTLTSAVAEITCGNGRLAVESTLQPRLSIAPNPVSGQEIRCHVEGIPQPEFRLTDATGRQVGLTAAPASAAGEYQLHPTRKLEPGLYVLEAREGVLRLAQRVLVVE